MTIILLEALAALALFVGAIWWTMFSGRDKGELRRREDADPAADSPPAEPVETQKNPDKK